MPRNVTLAGRDVGTFPEDDLAATVADIAEQSAAATVQVRTDDKTYETTAASLGLHLALGRPCSGPTAFRLSHLQAMAAHRVGARAEQPCHAYGAVELVSLIGDGELARDMVRRELGPLLGVRKGVEVLGATALAYLRTGQNVDAAAELMFVHPNTVRYRIGRIEELLGTRLGERATVLEASLSWLEVYGAAALD